LQHFMLLTLGCLLLIATVSLPRTLVYAYTIDPADVFINEIHYDNDGIDTGEFIEIAGPAGTDLANWSLVLYSGANGLVYNTLVLSGTITGPTDSVRTLAFTYSVNGIQNDTDGIALVNPSNTVIQFLSYEGSFTAANGPANGLTSTDIGVSENASTPVGFSLQLSGSGRVYQDFTWSSPADDTPGAVNNSQIFLSPTPVTLISLTGVADGAGHVLRWKTATELAIVGFHIYRSANGQRADGVKVTDEIIASTGSGISGGDYIWTDRSAVRGLAATYWLQTVPTSGEPEEYGLVTVSPAANNAEYRLLLPLLSR
jgi:hypothetical protein